jgi:hypothetical protein
MVTPNVNIPNMIPSMVKMLYPPMDWVPAPKTGKEDSSMTANSHKSERCSGGNFFCNAPSLVALACLRDRTVSYIDDGTPTLVRYRTISRGSSMGLGL